MWEHQGYATHCRELGLRLLDRIPNLKFMPTTPFPAHPEPIHHLIRDHSVNTATTSTPDLVVQVTPTVPYRVNARYLVLLTTIESARPHPGLVNRLTLADEVWVPSLFNKRILPHWLRRQRPVLVMPEGVDPTKFYPDTNHIEPYRAIKKLYLYHADWAHRKGIHILIPAWSNVQHKMPDAGLLLITKHGMCTEPEAVERLLHELYALLPKDTAPASLRILLITHTISDAELNRIYNQTYCGVLPTRGEAWSLFPHQLAAVGRPTITTAFGGHLDYLSHRNAYLISVSHFDRLMPDDDCVVSFYNFVPFPVPDREHLENLLLFTYNHPEDVERRGRLARQAVIPRYTWDRAADRIHRRIDTICRRL